MEPLSPTTIFENTSDAISEQEKEEIAARWWEVEAQKTLESTTSIEDIRLICKYVPFSDPNAGSLALSKQRKPRLDTLWVAAHVKYKTTWNKKFKVHEWTPSQVAERIFKLLTRGMSTLPRDRPYWTPPSFNLPVSAEGIAESLDSHFCLLFHYVCSRDWIKAALGYTTAVITSLLDECVDTRMILHQWYEQNIFPRDFSESVEKTLRSRNPLAHWAVSDHTIHPSEALDSLFHCFHILSARQEKDFMCWVRQLAVVTERFHQNLQAIDVDWNKQLLSGSTLFEQIKRKDLPDLARRIKDQDSADFRALKSEDFFVENGVLNGLAMGWQTLSDNARAFAIVDSSTGELIGQLAKQLHALRDYQSMAALLMGLQEAKVYPPDIPFALVDPDTNYVNYRTQWAKRPGIPFLFPHIKEIQFSENKHDTSDKFLKSWSFWTEEPYASTPEMIYNYMESKGPPTRIQGLGGWFNCIQCF